MNRPFDILNALQERETAALDRHLRALFAAQRSDLAAAVAAFTEASQWESANGYPRAALQTTHQSALTQNFGGDLDRLRRYYTETVRTLKRLRNREGVALCLRSLGELSLLHGQTAEAAKAWELSEQLFTGLQLPEAAQIAVWRACIAELNRLF